jgi:hypothetical protein
MASSTLAAMKNRSGAFSKLLADVEKIKSPSDTKNFTDDRIWKMTIDKSGNGAAVIRFLDAPKEEETPWCQIWRHGFAYVNGVIQTQGSKIVGAKWYLESSLTTLGQQDYVSEMNKIAWDSGDQDLARARKRTLNYYSNILVINDPEHPENNGKVFLFKYGKSIMDIIIARTKDSEIDPLDEDSEVIPGINPFCFWNGSDFALKIKRVKNWPSYIDSTFRKPKPLFGGDDDKIEAVWNAQYSLTELVDPSHFKSYDELKARFLAVVNGVSIGSADEADKVKFVEEPEDDVPVFADLKAPKVKAPKKMPVLPESDDDDLDFFAQLANND